MSIAGFALWIGTYLIGQLTPLDAPKILPPPEHSSCLLPCVFLHADSLKLVPETTGKSLEEIERYWMKIKN